MPPPLSAGFNDASVRDLNGICKHTWMNTEPMRSCPEICSLLVKRIAGELSTDDKNYVESHLAGCASCAGEEQWLSKVWQKFDTLPDPEIPTKLYEATHETILGHLKWETSSFPWIVKISEMGKGSAIFPILAGLVMTGISYSLVRNLVGSRSTGRGL